MYQHPGMTAAICIGLAAQIVIVSRPRLKLRHMMQEPCKRRSSARDFGLTFAER
jgi:hypothetical protein